MSTGTTGVSGSTPTTGIAGATGSPTTDASRSANWAGYAVSGSAGVVRHFRHVAGSWVQPAVTCAPGSRAYSAFWVGLGGLSQTSKALEQTGTEADCDRSGGAHYSAWYELVPAGPVTVGLAVHPGDSMSGAVSVLRGEVTMTLRDLTSGAHMTKRVPLAQPATTSAEWIAEAPSDCNGGRCRALPLSDFGAVTFTAAGVRLRDGAAGTIADPLWSTQAIKLTELAAPSFSGRMFGPRGIVTAVPSTLDPTGDSFAVSWARRQQTTFADRRTISGVVA